MKTGFSAARGGSSPRVPLTGVAPGFGGRVRWVTVEHQFGGASSPKPPKTEKFHLFSLNKIKFCGKIANFWHFL